MEPVTHFLTGACLGRSGFNRKTAYATLAMTIAAEAPDIDIVWGFRGPLAGFQHHRGITHTFLGAPFMALAVTGLIWLIHRVRKKPTAVPVRWGLVWLFALLADFSHLLLDYTNNYGVRPFFPFSPHWYARSIIFIFDPLIFLVLLSAFVMPWLFGLADREIGVRSKPFRGRGWATTALVVIVVYWSARNAERAHALSIYRAANVVSEPIVRLEAEPYPINPFNWHIVAETRNYYLAGEVNTLRDDVVSDVSEALYKPPVTSAVAAAKQSWLGQVYLDWSALPVVTDIGQSPIGDIPMQPGWRTVEFRDLRFAYPAAGLAGRNPLGAYAYIGPGGEPEALFMGQKEQKK